MKTICKIFLLVVLLCLTGCSSDDPQSVSFSIKTHETSYLGEILTVNVTANCTWTINETSQQVLIQEMSGNGDDIIRIHIAQNTEYDDLTHSITITSEDGTSSDVLTIKQETRIGTLAESIEMLSAEGGDFTIPIKTNDEITEVDTPEWITFISSRALTDYTYSFTAEPNKTGSARNGTITIRGKYQTKTITIEQDSYAPTGVGLLQDLKIVYTSNQSVGICLLPEYADWSKLKVKTSNSCQASIEEGYLKNSLQSYGKFNLSFIVNG